MAGQSEALCASARTRKDFKPSEIPDEEPHSCRQCRYWSCILSNGRISSRSAVSPATSWGLAVIDEAGAPAVRVKIVTSRQVAVPG